MSDSHPPSDPVDPLRLLLQRLAEHAKSRRVQREARRLLRDRGGVTVLESTRNAATTGDAGPCMG